jgi:hypothetical protein
MKKTILVLMIVFPVFCFSQVSEKKAKEIKETATEIMDAIDGVDPVKDYIKINEYVSKTFTSVIVKTSLDEYKKNDHFYLCFFPNKKTVGVFYLYKGKINLRPILLDASCQDCKVSGTLTYKELESKSLVSVFSEQMKHALAPFLANLIYNPDFITYMKSNN